MTMGIEHFRGLTSKTDLENRRVTVNQDMQEVRAPNNLWGRFVHWLKGTNVGEGRAQENREARNAFYQALVKAEGEDFAKSVIQRSFGMDSEQFVNKATNLQASKIKIALDTAGDMRREFRLGNERAIERYIANGNLGATIGGMAQTEHSTLGHPDLKKDDPDVRREFRKLVRLDPDYRHRDFTRDELDVIAQKAVVRALEIKKARFDEQYPELAKIDCQHFHDRETFFTRLSRDQDGQWERQVLNSLEDSTELLGQMSFNRTQVSVLRDETVRLRNELKDLRDEKPELRFQDAHDDLVRRSALAALENFPVEGDYPKEIQHMVEALVEQALSGINSGSIEDPEARKQVVDDLCSALDDQLIHRLANPDLYKEWSRLNNERRKINGSENPDREDQLKQIDVEIKKLTQELIDSTKDQRQQIIQAYREQFETRLSNDPVLKELPQLRQRDEQQYRLERECDNQIAKLDSKIEYLTSYLNQDPRSETSFRHDKLIWAKATVSVLEQNRDRIANEKNELVGLFRSQQEGDLLTDEQRQRLHDYDAKVLAFNNQLEFLDGKIRTAKERVVECEREMLKGEPSRDDQDIQLIEEDIEGGHEPEFNPKAMRDRLRQNRNDEVRDLIELLGTRVNMSPGRAAILLDQARERVLSNPDSITPIRRDMEVSRDGVTRTYRSENIPGGGVQLEAEWDLIANLAKENGYPESAFRVPNLQVSQLKQVVSKTVGEDRVVQEEVLKSQIIRHGVLDGFDIEDPELREQVEIMQTRQVLTLGVNLAPREFLVEARRRHEEGEERGKMVHVNIALSTSDPSGRRLDRRDGDLIQHQIDQFERFSGQNELYVQFKGEEIDQPDDDVVQIVSDHKLVDFDIDPITFSFTVSGKGTGTRFDEHDKQNMIKLLGDLAVGTAPGGYVGGVVDALQAKRDQPETSDTEKRQIDDMLGKIRREVDTARELFTSGAYKDTSIDPYKMARSVMRVVDLAGEGLRLSGDHSVHMSLSEGCRSNLEGGSKLDIEHKAQVIIEDMGGSMPPMQLDRGRSLNEQDRIIYNTVLTSSGDTEVRQRHTGQYGLGDMRDIGGRSRDIEALMYSSGIPDPNRR